MALYERDNFQPVFVVGNSRSGTTLMAKILGMHPDLSMFYETHFFEELWVKGPSLDTEDPAVRKNIINRLLTTQKGGYYKRHSPTEYPEECKVILDSLPPGRIPIEDLFFAVLMSETRRAGKKRLVEQTPRHLLFVEEILKSCPAAKIINMIRDGRDVVLSQKNKWKRRFLGDDERHMPFHEMVRLRINYNPITISLLWNVSIAAAERYANDAFKDLVLTIKFEELIQQPRQVIGQVCDFLNITFVDTMLQVPVFGSSNVRDGELVGINSKVSGTWKTDLTTTEAYICQKITGNKLTRYGYQICRITPNPILLIFWIVIWPFQTFLSFLVNIPRMGNIYISLRKRLNLLTCCPRKRLW